MINQQSSARSARVGILMFVFVFLVCSPNASAQWTTNGSNISNSNSGNVGIGTPTPTTALEVGRNVAGTPSGVTITGGSTVAAPVLYFNYADANTNLKRWLLFGDINGNFTIGTQPDAGGAATSKLFISNGGNVGIGTASPLGRVHLVTPSYTDTSIPVWSDHFFVVGADSNSGGISLSYNQTTHTGYLMSLSPNVAWRNTVIQPFAGNVGIGMTNPIYSLDVNGGVNAFRTKAATVSSNDAIATFENASGIKAIVRGNGYIGIGTVNPSKPLDVLGDINASGAITGGTINAKYQDVAEWVPSAHPVAPGTVVVLNPSQSNQVMASTRAYDIRVAGVISETPGLALGQAGPGKVLVATSGRVRVKVDATREPIAIGDLLVTSDIEGLAMKSQSISIGGAAIHRPGTLIGKALEPLSKGKGEILVLLSLQ